MIRDICPHCFERHVDHDHCPKVCVKCGKPEGAHIRLCGNCGIMGTAYRRCPGYVFTPKGPAPKAKPGVRYTSYERSGMGDIRACSGIGLANGRIAQANRPDANFTPDWTEVMHD